MRDKDARIYNGYNMLMGDIRYGYRYANALATILPSCVVVPRASNRCENEIIL